MLNFATVFNDFLSMRIKQNALWLVGFAFVLSIFATACSSDDHSAETIYHQSYVQGKVNGIPVSMDDRNEMVSSDKSLYEFKRTGFGETEKNSLDWEVKLVEDKDSVVTLFLHINDLQTSNTVIYSPNATGGVQSESTCYIEIKNQRTGNKVVYHPTQPKPTRVRWETFTAMLDDKIEYQKGLTIKYRTHQWPGIDGDLEGVFTEDSPQKKTVDVKFDFKLY